MKQKQVADVTIFFPSNASRFGEITRVELHDGFIRFLGKNIKADGTEVDGSFDLSLGAEDDMLKARIVAVDIPGVTLKDCCIVGANIEMALSNSLCVMKAEENTHQHTDNSSACSTI